MVEIGDSVKFVDEYGVEHNALVTTVFSGGSAHPGDDGPMPAVNVVYVTRDDTKHDQYGRQIERKTSVVNKAHQAAHGMFWLDG